MMFCSPRFSEPLDVRECSHAYADSNAALVHYGDGVDESNLLGSPAAEPAKPRPTLVDPGEAVGVGTSDVRDGVLSGEIPDSGSSLRVQSDEGVRLETPATSITRHESESLLSPAGPKEQYLRAGARRLATVMRAREMVDAGMSLRSAAGVLGVSASNLHRWFNLVRGIPVPTAADLADATGENGAAPQVPDLTSDELCRVRALYLQTNRTRDAGSVVEALLQAIEQEMIRPALAALIQTRMAAGQSPLTERQMRRLRISGPVVKSHRGPRRAWLDHVQSPGSLMLDVNLETGEEEFVAPGRRWTIDDGSINLILVVPGLERPGDPCWERWGVVVGRFQLLLTVDHRTRCIIGRSYTARPRDSYRAEDITSALHCCVADWGAPAEIVLEHGISAARLVSETLGALGVRIIRAASPHQKVVESVLNVLWTALSTLPCQVGRYRGEEEASAKLLRRIRDGAFDPRGHLMTLPDFLTALDAAIARTNLRWVEFRSGRAQPRAWFDREAPSNLRRIAAEDLWMFAPHVTKPLKVDGALISTSVTLMEGRSERFQFGDPSLIEWHGASVKLFFNPLAPDSAATAVLAYDFAGYRAGKLIGVIPQVDRETRHARRSLGYGIDPDIGKAHAAGTSRGLVRAAKAIRGDGSGREAVEVRDAKGNVRQVEISGSTKTPQEQEATASRHVPTGAVRGGQALGGSGNAQVRGRVLSIPAEDDPELAEFLE